MLISFSSATSSGSIHLVWAGGCRQIVSCMIRQRGLECVGGVSTCAGVGAGGGGGFCPGVLQGLSRERVVVLSGAGSPVKSGGQSRRVAAGSHHSDAQEYAWVALTQNPIPRLSGGDLMILDSPSAGEYQGPLLRTPRCSGRTGGQLDHTRAYASCVPYELYLASPPRPFRGSPV